ncbi:uncharacterized protein abca12 [Tachysurus fulvidraco]|uniref:uncharacterized protein abca12 n=1 Tax=Tachysurus fulvidraco TaxID=1234273 RepID=UPI001FEF9DF1|nr:uncharacterized protein abca12 [Tachysurus fulvidraco]
MAGFFQQLRLLLWKNALGIIRQPVWSLVLLIWPVVIFIILAITRSQFPPILKDPCYVAPRNLPSAGFFPFLQTLMCNTDSSCSNKSYLTESKSLRHRRDVNTRSSPLLPHGLPPLPDLEKLGLVHVLRKRETSNSTQILQQWDKWLNSSIQASSNLTNTILEAINSTIVADEDVLNVILDSAGTLKTIFCNISTSALSDYSHASSVLERFCRSNDTALEVSLSTLNQFMMQLVLQDPIKFIEAAEMSVETMDKLQTQSPLWDFLLGLPDIFLKSTDQDRILAIAEQLMGMKQALNSFQSSFQQANASMDKLNPVIDEGIDILNYLHTWKGRNVNISLANVLVKSNMSLVSPELATLQIPLDKVLVLFNRTAFSEFVCTSMSFCDSQQVNMIYGWIDQEKVALQVLLTWSRSATSPADLSFAKHILGKMFGGVFKDGPNTGFENGDIQQATLQEQVFLGIANTVLGMLSGTASWDYIQMLMMGAHSTMKVATAAMEAQLAYVQPLLNNPENLQAILMQNETAMHNMTPWLDVEQKINQISSVLNGTLVYNVTPAMILTEWHRLYSTAQEFSNTIMVAVQLFQDKLSSQFPHNSTIDWTEILLNSSLEEFAMLGPVLQNSSLWSTLETHFQLAYWIMTFQPNITKPPNCTFTLNDTVCQMAFTWEGFIPVVRSLLQEIRENPAALLRPIQGAEFLLKDFMMDIYMNHLQEFLNSTGHSPPGVSPQNVSMSLTDLVNQNLQLLLNIPPTDELDEDILLSMLNDTLEAFGLGQLGVLWSEDSNYSNPNAVVMNILHLLSPEYIQTVHSEGKFTVLCGIIRELLDPEQHMQLEGVNSHLGVFNHTYALFEDLAFCEANGHDCLSEVSHLFQILSSLDEMMPAGEGGNFTMMPIEYNMTLSIAGHILFLLLPGNMSESSPYAMHNVSEIIHLLEQLSGSPNFNISTIQKELQSLNISIFDLAHLTHLSEASPTSMLLSNLTRLDKILQCLNPLLQNSTSHMGSRVTDCTMQIIEGLTGFLQAIPMLEGSQLNLTSILNMVFDEAMELRNMSSLAGDANSTTLYSVVMNILHLLRPESNQMHNSEGKFTVLCSILKELLDPEQQMQLEGVFNHTYALFEDLAFCAANGHDCLQDVSHLFQILSSLDEMMPAGEGGNFTMMPIKYNMTLSLAGHILFLLLPGNMSESSPYAMHNVSEIIHLLEQLSGSPNFNISTIQKELQSLNITIFDLAHLTHLSEASPTSMLLSNLTELDKILQCLNPLLQNSTSHMGSRVTDCTMQIIEGLTGFLQAIPMLEGSQLNLTSILNMVFDEAMELRNMSSLAGDANSTTLYSVVMNILHLLRPESNQMHNSEGKFTVLCSILKELLDPEQQMQLEGVFNHTYALFEDLAFCAANGHDCLQDVSHLFQILSSLDEMMPAGEGGNFTMMPIKYNMTLSVAGHILFLLLSGNMSESSPYAMHNVSEIIHLLEQLSGSPNFNISTIQKELQSLNISIFDLAHLTHLSEASPTSMLLSNLTELDKILQCLNPLLQNSTSHMGSRVTDCTMQIIEGLTGFLQAIPMLEGSQLNLTSILNMVFDEAMELRNMSSLAGDANSTTLYSVVMNILHLLRPESNQMHNSEGKFKVLCSILKELLDPEQQMQLEGVFNHTYALFEDLAFCAANGHDCLQDVSHLFQILSSLDEMMPAGEGRNFTMMPIKYNMTLSVAGHILFLLLPGNMSESSLYGMDNISVIIHLLEQLYASPDFNISAIQEELQASNITLYDVENVTHLSEATSTSVLLSNLMELVNTLQCLDPPLLDNMNSSHIGSTVPDCTMQIIEGLTGFLQAIPMLEGSQLNLTSILNMVFDKAMELRNMSSLENDFPGMKELLSGGSNSTTLYSVVMNILHVLRPESIQMLNSEGKFAVSDAILHELQPLFAKEHQINLEGFLNTTHALFEDLAFCDQDCLSGVSHIFQMLSLLNESMLEREGNFTMMPIKNNMTFSVAGHILSLLLSWNISESSANRTVNVSEITYFLEQLYSSPNLSLDNIQELLEALNLTMSDFEQFSQLSEASSISLILSTLMDIINSSQCAIPLSPGGSSLTGSPVPECSMKIFEGLIGFLQALPMFEGYQTSLTTTLNMLYDEAMEFRNISNSDSDPLEVTEEVFELILESIRQNLENLNVENVTSIETELDTLEELLKMVFEEEYHYPYYMINSTMMTQQAYAHKMYKEITLWYLHNLENATSDSMFREILYPFIEVTEMMVTIHDAHLNFSTLVANQIQNLTGHVQTPLNGEDLNLISNAIVSLIQGQLELIKMNLDLQQTFLDSLGLQSNTSMPADIKAELQNYHNLMQNWITNPQLKLAFSNIFRWTNNLTDFTTPFIDHEELLQALASLLTPEEQVYINKTEQVLHSLNYTLQLGQTENGLQSENFTEAIMDSVRVFLDNMFNYTDTTYTNDDIVDVFYNTLQLLLNPNISHDQAQKLVIQVAQETASFISAIVPDSSEVLTPIIQSLITSINTISNPGEPAQWKQAFVAMLEEIHSSLPYNSTANTYISSILDITNYILNPKQGNTSWWASIADVNPDNLDNVTQPLSVLLDFVLPFLMDHQGMGLTHESAHALIEYVPNLVQIFSRTADQLTFQRLENMTTVLLLNLMTTPAGDSVPFALDLIRNVTASLVQSMRVQTELVFSLSGVLPSCVFSTVDSSNISQISDALLQAFTSTLEATQQVPVSSEMLNCSSLENLWEQVAEAEMNSSVFTVWCNDHVLPLLSIYQAFNYEPAGYNVTAMDPQWVEATVAEIVSSLKTFYSAELNESQSMQHLHDLQNFTESFNQSLCAEGNISDWSGLFSQIHSLPFAQMALESAMLQLNNSGGNPYVLAVQKAIEYMPGNQNVTASPEMVVHALDVVLTAMNFSRDQIDSFLSSDVFTMQYSLPIEQHMIKEVLSQITDMRLFGNWSIMYNIMEQLQHVENTSNVLSMVHELVSWYNTTEDTGVYFGIKMLTKLYEMLTPFVPNSSPLPCSYELFIGLTGNALYALEHMYTANLFPPINFYPELIQTQLAQGQNLRNLVSETQSARRAMQNLTREPVDDFLDLLDINYQNLSEILSIPPSSEEMLETMHVFFANPDLGIFLKGVTRSMTGSLVEDETIDTILGTLAYLTLPSNGETFLEMITQTTSQAWGLNDMQMVESLGGVVGMIRMLSQQPSLSIAQKVEQIANQLTSAATYTMAHQGNRSEILTAFNNIMSQNLQQMQNTSLEDHKVLQSIIGSLLSKSQFDFESYMMAMNQTSDALAYLVPPEEMVYFNMSTRMMEAFALLMSYPTDLEKVMMSSHEMADSMNLSFALSNMTTLPNGRPIDTILYPFILNSAVATQILFNLSASNYTFSSDLDRNMILTQMMSKLPGELQPDLYPVTSALLLALSNFSDTANIRPVFFQTSQNVTMYLVEHLNLTGDPMSMEIYSVLSTVSNQVSSSLCEALMGTSSISLLPNVLNSLHAVTSLIPLKDRQYPDAVYNFMETLALTLNHTITTGDAAGGMNMLSDSVQRLLMTMMPNSSMDNSSGIMTNLENTVKVLLMVLSSGQDPLTQSANVTSELLSTIQNLLTVANSSSEIDLATLITGAFKMNAGSLLSTNDSNWSQKLQMVLLSVANTLPADLQFGPFNRTIFESLANEPKENLNILLQTVSTVSQLFSTNWKNESFGDLLNEIQTQGCSLEKMKSVQLFTQALSLSPGLLCNTVLPSIGALHVLSSSLVNQSSDIYDLLYQHLVGDPSTYDLKVNWTSILSDLLGMDLGTLLNSNSNPNQTTASDVKVSAILKNVTLFVSDVTRHTSIPHNVLNTLLDLPLPKSNLQVLSEMAKLQHCTDLTSLKLDPVTAQIFSSLCSLPGQEWYRLAVLTAQHVSMEEVMYKLLLNSEIQSLTDIVMRMVKFFMDWMSKLTPALNRLQEYFTSFGNMKLMSNSEFSSLVRGKRSTMSSRATFVTISRALCNSGMLSLFGISQLPSMSENNLSVEDQQKVEDLMTKFKIPKDSTPFCRNFYLDMVSTTGGAVAWAFLKPMLLGQVLYYPDTPITQGIITRSNLTLQQFGDLRVYADEWLRTSSYLMQSAQLLNKTLPMLKNSLSNPFIQNFIKKQIDIDIGQMQETLNNFSDMAQMLEKNQFILKQITTLSTLMMNLSSCVNFDRYRAFNSLNDLNKQAEKLAQNRELYASIIFKLPNGKNASSSSTLPPKLDYTIRMNIDNSMRTDRSRSPFWVRATYISSASTQRYNRGFIYLQESIERAIIGMQTGNVVQEPAVQIQAFPYPCYYRDEYLNSIAFAFPLVLMISWVLFIANFVKKLVHERELRLHEYMKMMGVNPFSHYLAWFIESAAFLLVTVIILTIILKSGGVLPKSNGFVLFLYLSDYALSILAISFLISTFFDKTNIAGLSGSLIYVICFFPFIVVVCMEETLPLSIKTLLSLFSPTCFSYASQYITRYEKQEEGIQWHNMYLSPVVGDDASFGWLCWLLLIDSVVYFLLGAYIRTVFPGRYGIAAPWYFPFTSTFWANVCGCNKKAQMNTARGLLFSNMMQESQRNSKEIDKDTPDLHAHGDEEFQKLPVGVLLRGLTKSYGNRNAIENLNLAFYEGHVTSLLGHNGAGKTTTMSLLTGLFAPSSGMIEVYGKDMQSSMKHVRKELGVCMQYDVHFDHMTTEEHLLLYGHIKAPHWSKQELQQEVRKTLEETGMYPHRHKKVGTLSGGMKRKLSISIAFIGGSRLVVLDEPTTGVDPCSRRSIWDIVLQHKSDRTIILSTHHLDEAEVLSDRIAFLERGGLKCCGSPYYLKDKLARGYKLTLTKKVLPPDSDDRFDTDMVKSFVHTHLPEAQLKEGAMGDIVYSLPVYNSQNASAYRSLLCGLDHNLEALQLGCYGISDTTLEEVFLQLTRDSDDREEELTRPFTVSNSELDAGASRDSLSDELNSSMYFGERTSLTGRSTLSGLALKGQQVMAMLTKRVHHTRRNWKGLISQVLLPVLFVLAAMGLGSIKSNLENFPETELTPAMYDSGRQYTFFSNQNSSSSYLVDSMMSYPGIAHYCMDHPDSVACQKKGTSVSDQWISEGTPTSLIEQCKCGNFSQTCPKPAYIPPHKTNPSSQIVYNLTNIDVENYLQASANDFIRDRYGGWSFGNPLPSSLKMDILEVPQNRTLTKVWYNPEGHHTMPAYLNSLNNFILRSQIPASKQPEQYAISVSSHPYPGQVEEEDALVRNLVNVLVAMCVLTGFSIMTASFVIYEVQEHHSGSKMLQHISGISETFYWIINFFYDMALYMVPVTLSIIVIAAFQLPAFTDRLNLGAVSLLLVLFGFASFPWMYLISTLFKDTEMAFISYVCVNLFISMNSIISTAIVYFLGQASQNNEHIQVVYRTLSKIFLVFPQFSFGNGLMELARVDLQVQILSTYGVDAYKNPFGLDVLGWMFISMFLQGFICFSLRLLMNKSLFRKVRRLWSRRQSVPQTGSRVEDVDEDVLAERQRVDSGAASSDLLQVSRLSKVYRHLNRRVQAVNKLSFGIPAGECFGLLGVNGAGKTTTFKMLTGDISPSHGSAQVLDWDGKMVDIMDCRTEGINIGYCPQVDALDNLLTGEEHLYFYARIRGICKREIDQVVNYLLKKLELNYYRQIISERYSCGTRRKLSTALALIGQPQILLLDEPSSGMDPRSKRHLWKIISEEVMGKCAVVLTSHSMEECEALCTRLAIMVQGQFRCLGSLQHIKNRFGSGFTVKMYLTSAACDVDSISTFMQQHFPSTFLKDHHSSMVEYHVPLAPGGVADIFDQLESNKAALKIKNFSVSQTTLDEVFINFAMGKVGGAAQDSDETSDVDDTDSQMQ